MCIAGHFYVLHFYFIQWLNNDKNASVNDFNIRNAAFPFE